MNEHELTLIDGIGPATAIRLSKIGIESIADLASAAFEDIQSIRGSDPAWIREAQLYTQEYIISDKPVEALPMGEIAPIHGELMLLLSPGDMDRLQQLRDTYARKRFDQSMTLEDAIEVALSEAMQRFGIA